MTSAIAIGSGGCALHHEVVVTSEPEGARIWLGHTPVGQTPLRSSVNTTGPLEHFTFDPVYVTAEAPGHRQQVRPLSYEWSWRNIALALPTLTTSFWFWSRQPADIHLVLEPE